MGEWSNPEVAKAAIDRLQQEVLHLKTQVEELEGASERWNAELAEEFPPPKDGVPFPVYVARQIRQGASYDGEAGVWRSSESKPGILRQAEARTAQALAQAAAWEAWAKGLEGVVAELERRTDLYEKGEDGDSREAMIRWRGLAAGSRDAANLLRQALSAPRPEPGRVLEVVRAAVRHHATNRGPSEMAYVQALEELEEAVERLTPEERQALGEETP